MKIAWTLLLTLLTATALTSSKPRAIITPQAAAPDKALATNDNRPAPIEKFIR